MTVATRRLAIIAVVVALSLLTVAAWSGYREASWLLLIDALPTCG